MILKESWYIEAESVDVQIYRLLGNYQRGAFDPGWRTPVVLEVQVPEWMRIRFPGEL